MLGARSLQSRAMLGMVGKVQRLLLRPTKARAPSLRPNLLTNSLKDLALAAALTRCLSTLTSLCFTLLVVRAGNAQSLEQGSLLPYGRHLAQECTACHGADAGQGKESGIPRLAGRPAAELTDLLHAFREGRRTNPVMVSVAKSLDEKQIAALAAYFASLSKAPDGAARAP